MMGKMVKILSQQGHYISRTYIRRVAIIVEALFFALSPGAVLESEISELLRATSTTGYKIHSGFYTTSVLL